MENQNMSQKITEDVFFESLKEIINSDCNPSRIHVSINGEYVSIENAGDKVTNRMMYDGTAKKLMSEKEWFDTAYKYNLNKDKEIRCILQKMGILFAYNSIEQWLLTHEKIKTMSFVEKNGDLFKEVCYRDLKYGCKLRGVIFMGDQTVWEITVFDRAIKENDIVKNMDTVHLMFDRSVHEGYLVNDSETEENIFVQL